jgi:hypothetical protein
MLLLRLMSTDQQFAKNVVCLGVCFVCLFHPPLGTYSLQYFYPISSFLSTFHSFS